MIKIFSHYIRKILDSFRDSIRVIKHYDLIKHNGYIIIFKIFIIKFFYSFSFIRNFKKIIYRNEIINSNFFEKDSVNIDEDLKQIDELGYSKIYNIKDKTKNQILDMVLNCENLDLKKIDFPISEILKKKDEELEEYLERLKEKKVSRITGSIDLKNNSILRELLTSTEMLTLVKNYLNTKVISINASFFISNPVITTNDEKYSNAQYFHWDNDFTKFIKFYVYLSDVDDYAGPHIFVEKSHKYKKREHRLCRLFSDYNINQNYRNIKKFTGKSGSAFFEDSYGLHKGEPPKTKSRIILNVHFGANKILYSSNDIILNL